MPAIHVRDVPEATLSALRERATHHGHSMQQEIREILSAAAAEPHEGTTLPPIELVKVRTSSTSTWGREEIYGDDGR